MIGLRGIVYRLDLSDDSPEIQRLAAGYLSRWSAYGDPERFQAAFREAQVIVMVNRAISWYQVVSALPQSDQQVHIESVSGWLEEFLENFKKLSDELHND
jgi:hypothetical protein